MLCSSESETSYVARVTGIEDRWHQLLFLGALNVVIWLLESATEYGYSVTWRNLAQTVQHEARMDCYAHVQRLELAYFEDQSTGGLMAILLLLVGKIALLDPLISQFALLAAPKTIHLGVLVAVLLAASVGVSAAGSGLSLRRFLRV